MSNIFNLFSSNKDISINKDIILHENINIISNYFFNCFENNIYNKLKQNTNYEILKSNIKEIFTYSINTYILQHAKEQSKDINYINDVVKNKDNTLIINKISLLHKQHISEYNKNFDKILFNFTDLLLEYCGLRNGDLFKNDTKEEDKEKELDNFVNILINKYKLKYAPEQLKQFIKTRKTKTNIYFDFNQKKEELSNKRNNLIKSLDKYKEYIKLFGSNDKLFDKLKDIKDPKEFKRVFDKIKTNNSIMIKITDSSFKDIINKITEIAYLNNVIEKIIELSLPLEDKTLKFNNISYRINNQSRQKQKTRKIPSKQTIKQKPKKSKEKITEPKSRDKKEQQQTIINNDQQQIKQEQKEQKEQKQIKQEEPQKQVVNNNDKQIKLEQQQKQQEEQKEKQIEDINKIEENKLEEKDNIEQKPNESINEESEKESNIKENEIIDGETELDDDGLDDLLDNYDRKFDNEDQDNKEMDNKEQNTRFQDLENDRRKNKETFSLPTH